MRRHMTLLAALMLVVQAAIGQETGTEAATGSSAGHDTVVVREILNAVGKEDVAVSAVVAMDGGRVVKLDLANKSLEEIGIKTLPASVGNLTALKQLILNKNVLTALPASVAELSALQILDVGDNELTEVPVWIGKLQNLRRLDLRNNEFGDLPAELFTLKKLTYLQLHGNDLKTISEKIGEMSSLKELYLERNRLTMLPVALTTLKSLEYIDYGYNKLCELNPTVKAWLVKRDKKYRQLQKCW